MAKDDYFYVVYRILSYLYQCLKRGHRPDITRISYGGDLCGINKLSVRTALLLKPGKRRGILLIPSLRSFKSCPSSLKRVPSCAIMTEQCLWYCCVGPYTILAERVRLFLYLLKLSFAVQIKLQSLFPMSRNQQNI